VLKTKNEKWKKVAKRRQTLERNGFATEAPSARRKSGRLLGACHPRVFLQKSLDLLDCKGVEFFGDDKEFATV
jgi:hypothetical protein